MIEKMGVKSKMSKAVRIW